MQREPEEPATCHYQRIMSEVARLRITSREHNERNPLHYFGFSTATHFMMIKVCTLYDCQTTPG